MSELKSVIFDLDGVLVDSHFLHYKSWQRLADELGLNFDEKMGDTYRGMERSECMRIMFEEFNAQSAPPMNIINELTDKKNVYYLELLNNATAGDLLLPGSIKLLESLRSENIGIVIASGSKNAKQVIRHAGFQNLVDTIIDRFDVENTKPDPAIFLEAIKATGFPAENSVGIEDALLGVEALRAAGLKSIGVGHYVDTADLHVEKIADLTIEMMRKLLNK
ncbi:MAG: beta-phosphoglucomutase [Chlamydiae bacterium]|nr:MAG: beta-phosphoglucomutase [Chlamydiota bacterium]